ncbi:MAG: GTPase ObgE [Clostridiales bacterium]|jgi:GTP-binding protein|nr:GTPase ObgE [Clostridiales bacterium]
MFIDKAKIFIKAGKGGDGTVSFYTEKYISDGGPDGGDGGKGGDVIFEADGRKTSLLDFSYASRFRAGDGERGGSRFCSGKNGKNLIIKAPRGTLVRDAESGRVIADLFDEGARVTVLTGGKGGKGNARFKSSRRHAPHFAQTGEETVERAVLLELKLIADAGLIGFPNAGKSTLLSVISAAKPKIADYHFTTLSPNLGVVKYYDRAFTVADIPGLIEGAGSGAGLGREFLRHVDRTRLLIHVVDISGSEGRDPMSDYRIVNKELKTYDPRLSALPQIIALNKSDLLGGDDAKIKEFRRRVRKPVFVISAAARTGTDALVAAMCKKLTELPPPAPIEFEPFEYVRPDPKVFSVTRFNDGAFGVSGGMMDELARNVSLDDYDSFLYFQRKLKDEGVIKALKKAGIKNGDTVRILDVEFEYVD